MIRIKPLLDIIEIGKPIEIERVNKENTFYTSQILDIINEEEIIIGGPIIKSNFIFMHKDELINLYYTVENVGRYFFTAKVISRELSPIYILRIKNISKIRKIQIREHFRLPIGLLVKKEHQILNNGEMEKYYEDTEAKDISGGGMKLNCNFKHKVNDKIHCKIHMNDSIIEVNAIVIRVEEIDTFGYKYAIGVSFADIEEVSREMIISYIFEKQRILRNKGLI